MHSSPLALSSLALLLLCACPSTSDPTDAAGASTDGGAQDTGDGDGDTRNGEEEAPDGGAGASSTDGGAVRGDTGDGEGDVGDGDGEVGDGDGDGDPAIGSAGCGSSAPDDGVWTLTHDGREREYRVHLPTGYDPNTPTPVLLSYHGLNVSANLHMMVTRYNDVADDEGFIVVYPSGVSISHNAGVCCGTAQSQDVDDVGFAHAMLDTLESELCVDTKRVYANGLSNGGFMSYRLACEAADRFAAIGSVAGVTGVLPCVPSRAVPIVHFHGTDDAIVPYDGNFAISYMSVATHIDNWVGRNGCSSNPTVVYDEGDVLCERYGGCDNDVLVELCTVDGGGHQWFGGGTIPLLGTNTDNVDASQRLWDLLSGYALP